MIREKLYENLKVLKYDRKVFQKNLWHTDPMLVEYRGLVMDYEDNIVSYPFTKVFNIGENGTEVDPDLMVVCPRKINGFMAAATWYKGKRLTSTTGTLDSDHVKMANEKLDETDIDELLAEIGEWYTLTFEIVHENDPHIVYEEPGAYLIGAREKYIGSHQVTENRLDELAKQFKFKRPEVWKGKFKFLPTNVKHEGWMVRDHKSGKILAKVKSKHYLVKKFLMRSKKAYNQAQVEEEYYGLINAIRKVYTEEEWINLTEQKRGQFVECFISLEDSRGQEKLRWPTD